MNDGDSDSFGASSSDSDKDAQVLKQRRSKIAERRQLQRRRSDERLERHASDNESRRASDSSIDLRHKFPSNDSQSSTRISSSTEDAVVNFNSDASDDLKTRKSSKRVQLSADEDSTGRDDEQFLRRRRDSGNIDIIMMKKFEKDIKELPRVQFPMNRLGDAVETLDSDSDVRKTIESSFQETLSACLSAAFGRICDASNSARDSVHQCAIAEEYFKRKEAEALEQGRRCRQMQTNYMKEVIHLRDRLNQRRSETLTQDTGEEVELWNPLQDLDPATRDMVMIFAEEKIKSSEAVILRASEAKNFAIQQELAAAQEKIRLQTLQISKLSETETTRLSQALTHEQIYQNSDDGEDVQADSSKLHETELENLNSQGNKSVAKLQAPAQQRSRRPSGSIAARSPIAERSPNKALTCPPGKFRSGPQGNDRDQSQDLAEDKALRGAGETSPAALKRNLGRSGTLKMSSTSRDSPVETTSRSQANSANNEVCHEDGHEELMKVESIEVPERHAELVSQQDLKAILATPPEEQLHAAQSYANSAHAPMSPPDQSGVEVVEPQEHSQAVAQKQEVPVQACDESEGAAQGKLNLGSADETLQALVRRPPGRDRTYQGPASPSRDSQVEADLPSKQEVQIPYTLQSAGEASVMKSLIPSRPGELPLLIRSPHKALTSPPSQPLESSQEVEHDRALEIAEDREGRCHEGQLSESAQEISAAALAPIKRPPGRHRTFHRSGTLTRNSQAESNSSPSQTKEKRNDYYRSDPGRKLTFPFKFAEASKFKSNPSSGSQVHTDDVQEEPSKDNDGRATMSANPLPLSLPLPSPSGKGPKGSTGASSPRGMSWKGPKNTKADASFDPSSSVDGLFQSCGTSSIDASAFGAPGSSDARTATDVPFFGPRGSSESQKGCPAGTESLDIAAFGHCGTLESQKVGSPQASVDLAVFGTRSSVESQRHCRATEGVAKQSAKGKPGPAASPRTKQGSSLFRWMRPPP